MRRTSPDTKKTFDCVAFKRKAQTEIYEDIHSLVPEAQREYFRSQAESGPLGAWWKAVKARSRVRHPVPR